jgi:hypothetical protein
MLPEFVSEHFQKIAARRGRAIPPLVLWVMALLAVLWGLAGDAHLLAWLWEQWPQLRAVVVPVPHLGLIALVSFIAGTVWFLILAITSASGEPSTKDKSHTSIKQGYSEKPTPAEIETEVNCLTPFQQGSAKDSYIGLKVSWPVDFSSLLKVSETDHTYTVFSRFYETPSSSAVIVTATINIEHFPRLKSIHRGTQLRITGTISEVAAHGDFTVTLTLKDVDIEFEE